MFRLSYPSLCTELCSGRSKAMLRAVKSYAFGRQKLSSGRTEAMMCADHWYIAFYACRWSSKWLLSDDGADRLSGIRRRCGLRQGSSTGKTSCKWTKAVGKYETTSINVTLRSNDWCGFIDQSWHYEIGAYYYCPLNFWKDINLADSNIFK